MGASGYILRRLGYGILLLLGVVVLNFLLIHAAPGDPAEVIAGEMGGATEEMMARIRADYGLDKPLIVQLGIYLGDVATGDLGPSYFFNQPVIELIGARIVPTILLVVAAQLIAIILGVGMGVLAARRPQGAWSAFVSVFSTIGYAAPVFWTGLMLIIVFASMLPLFPVEGMESAPLLRRSHRLRHRRPAPPVPAGADAGDHLPGPVCAALARLDDRRAGRRLRAHRAREGPVGAGGDLQARPAQRGAAHRHRRRHPVRQPESPAPCWSRRCSTGPGMGRLAFDSVLRRDYPTLLGVLFFAALMVVVANLLTDLSYRLADPRIRTGGSRK